MRLFAAIFFLLASMTRVWAQDRMIGWGAESWDCGSSWYSIQVESTPGCSAAGNCQDVEVTSVTGWISAAANPMANQSLSRMRQSLVAVTYDGAQSQAKAVIYGNPSQPRYQHEVNGNLYAVNVKQTGATNVHIPATANFASPVRIPQGKLQMLIHTVTYDGAQDIYAPTTECLDTEVHLIVNYRLMGP